MQFYADNHEKHLQGGWTGDRVLFVGTPKYAISNIEIDNLQIANNGDQWVHATIGQPIVMTGATADYATANFHLHHVTLTTKSFNGYSNGGVLDRFSIRSPPHPGDRQRSPLPGRPLQQRHGKR